MTRKVLIYGGSAGAEEKRQGFGGLFSSVAARQGFTFHASIGMAKGAVDGLTLSLAAETATRTRVNAIAPSLRRTPLAEDILANEKTAAAIAGMHALERVGTPEDIAALVAFLLSPEADTGRPIQAN